MEAIPKRDTGEVGQFPDFGDRKRVRNMGLRSKLVGLLPFAAMVVVECLDVGLTTLSKAAMSKGMSHYVFVVYSNALATLILIPASFIIHRSSPCPSTNPHAFFFFLFSFSLIIDIKVCYFTFAFRNKRPPLTISVLCKFFLLSLAGYGISIRELVIAASFFSLPWSPWVLQDNFDAELCLHWRKLQLSYPCICYEQLGPSIHFLACCNLQVLFFA